MSHAMILGVELLIEFYKELSGEQNVVPVQISELKLCSYSMASLNWLLAVCYKLEKLQKWSIYSKWVK